MIPVGSIARRLLFRAGALVALAFWMALPAPAQPSISLSPLTHNYGDVNVGQTRQQAFRVRNNGNEELRGMPSLFAGVHFAINNPDSFSVAPGGFVDVVVSFAPIRPGQQFDSLYVSHNAPNQDSPVAAWMTGVGIPRPAVEVTPLSYDFDTVAVRTSAQTSIWVKNIGSGMLSMHGSITMGAPNYTTLSGADPVLIPAGDSVAIVVEYAPLQVTRHTGRLRVDHNGVNATSPINVMLSGVGAQAITIDPYEPNNSPPEAVEIEAGFVSDSTEIWPNGDVDYFRFSGLYGEWLTITADVTPNSTLNSKLWLYDEAGNLIAENDNAGSNDRSQIIDTLSASGVYYIRVAFAGNPNGFPNEATSKSAGEDPIGEYRLSLVRTGSDPLAAPSLIAPADSVFNERVNPTLSWTPVLGARTYDVIIATNPTFATGTVVFQSSRTDTSVTAQRLPPGRALYWHVRAGNELGVGPFSESRSFQTTFAPVVVSQLPDILLPEASTTVDLRPVFSDPEGGQLTYRTVSLSDSAVVATAVSGATLTVQQIGSGSTTVTVGARDPQGAETTTAFGVIAGEATASDYEELPPDHFGIGRNYPNPFADQSVIPIYLSASGHAELAVYDIVGHRVASLVDGQLSAGRHDVKLSADNLATGLYFVRLESASKSAISTIVVGR